ncbi:MAG: hypothetical protein DCF31_08940 [Alphaproteobacteria bacterium]|nr:MAG: hypothetical protein DCF31_08940 [Alphaproteobacteria bacterium]
MSIVRWVLLTALAVAFLLLAVANWTPVPFRLPDGTMIFIRLPLLLAIAFVAGWLPTWLWHLGSKATLTRKLAKTGNGEVRTSSLPSQAQPTIVPPAGA